MKYQLECLLCAEAIGGHLASDAVASRDGFKIILFIASDLRQKWLEEKKIKVIE